MERKMQNDYDCGPAMLSTLLNLPIQEVKQNWAIAWKNRDDMRDDLFDFPGMLFTFMVKRKIPFKLLDHPRNGTPGKTGILLHLGEGWFDKFTVQHWVPMISKTDEFIMLDWGNGKLVQMSWDVFERNYNVSFPIISFEVDAEELNFKNHLRIGCWRLLSMLMYPILFLL